MFSQEGVARCLFVCNERWSLLENDLSHWRHLKGLCPVCFLMCLIRSKVSLYYQCENYHGKKFVIKGVSNKAFWKAMFPMLLISQMKQMKGFCQNIKRWFPNQLDFLQQKVIKYLKLRHFYDFLWCKNYSKSSLGFIHNLHLGTLRGRFMKSKLNLLKITLLCKGMSQQKTGQKG